jgi:hypothetical protein
LAATFAVGAAAGVVAGWGFSEINRQAPVAPAAPARIETALAQQPAPTPILPVVAEPPPAPLLEVAPPAPVAAQDEGDGPTSPDTGKAGDAAGAALELPASASGTDAAGEAPRAVAVRAAATDACAAEPTPADREICGDEALQRLQRELRQAYAEALDAHQDRALLRQRQLAWRSVRDGVSDPQRLARLYEERIRKLNAATAEARRER